MPRNESFGETAESFDRIVRGQTGTTSSDAETPEENTPYIGADGGAHGPPLEPEPDVNRAIRDAFARSPKRL
jgi:hypothetical protein